MFVVGYSAFIIFCGKKLLALFKESSCFLSASYYKKFPPAKLTAYRNCRFTLLFTGKPGIIPGLVTVSLVKPPIDISD